MVSDILGIALDCTDAGALAEFYSRLLGLPVTIPHNGAFAGIRLPQGLTLAFQTVDNYVPPVWPWQAGEQQQMAHIDFRVDDLPAAQAHAIACGATRAAVQYYTTSTVMLDPAGHPFCLSTADE